MWKYLCWEKYWELTILDQSSIRRSRSVITECTCGIKTTKTTSSICHTTQKWLIHYCGYKKMHYKLTGIDISAMNESRLVARAKIREVEKLRDEAKKKLQEIKDKNSNTDINYIVLISIGVTLLIVIASLLFL